MAKRTAGGRPGSARGRSSRSTSSRPSTRSSQRTPSSADRRSFRNEDFYNRTSNQRDYTFTSFFEEEEVKPRKSVEERPPVKMKKRGPAWARTAQKAEKPRKESGRPGKRSGAVIQKKAKKAPISFSLPQKEEGDFTIIACVVILSVIGLVMVMSSSYYYAYTELGDSMHFFRRQFMWLLVSGAAMVFATKFPLQWLKPIAKIAYIVSVFFSVIVLFIGSSKNGSVRWIELGPLSFQPAELAKIGVVLYMSVLVEKHQDDITDKWVFMKLLAVMAVPTMLVAYQNLSSGLIIAAIGVIIMFVGGARWKHFFVIVVPIVVGIALVVVLPMLIDIESLPEFMRGFMEDFMYRTERVQAWLDPFKYAQDEGFQTVQSLYAVGSGGFMGRGLGQSIQKLGFIPEAHNDIIFSVICEELGLFGATIVIVLFGIFTWHGIKISLFAPNKYTALLSAGIVGQIAVQAILNIAVNTNSIPATGISLPFISYGGSSMLFLMVSVGIVLNISGYTRKTSAA